MKSIKIYIILSIIFFISAGCVQQKMDADSFNKLLSHRNMGLAYLEEERYTDAVKEFKIFINIAPSEAFGYANAGWAYLQSPGKLDSAEIMIEQAMKLSPGNPDISFLAAKVFELTNRTSQAVEVLQNTITNYPEHVLTLYQLSEYYRQPTDNINLQKAEDLLHKIVETLPGNIAAQLKLIDLSIKNGHSKEALYYMETVRQILPALPTVSVSVFNNAVQLLRNNNVDESMVPALMFHNLLKSTTYYKSGITELRGNPGPIPGLPLYSFKNLKTPKTDKEGPGVFGVQFVDISDKVGLGAISQANIVLLSDYDGDGDDDLFISKRPTTNEIRNQFIFANDGGIFKDISTNIGIDHKGQDIHAVTADYDNDGSLDILILNDRRSRLYKNNGEGKFIDVTYETGISFKSNAVQTGFVDYDLEGDLDLFIVTKTTNQLFRNNGDGTFKDVSEESRITGESVNSTDMSFGDFDDDGDVDIIVLNSEDMSNFFDNRRQGIFSDISTKSGIGFNGRPNSLIAGDYNNDGFLDIFIADLSGQHHAIFKNRGDGTFIKDKKSLSGVFGLKNFSVSQAIFSDLDNDGYLDLLVAGSSTIDKNKSGLMLLRNDGYGNYTDESSSLPNGLKRIEQVSAVDLDNDGDLEIIMVNDLGQIQVLRNDGGNLNNFLNIRLAGLRTGSSKNNYFGIGSKLEVKSDGLYQMRSVDRPVSHFGLGERNRADVVRVIWSNGVPQNRFTPQKNQTIVEEQILKGSCPYLYAWDGTEFVFVNDVLWPSALGMPLGIMAGEPLYAFPNSTDEYLSVPGEKVRPKDGKFELRFTTELWESPYLDNVKLIVLDHPDSVEVYINETFIPPPYPPFRTYNISNKYLPLSAVDQAENDLREAILAKDKTYTKHLTAGAFQGITELHDLILDFGNLTNSDSIFLFLQGWLFPTDASINVNISQSNTTNLIFPKLQVINDAGIWETVIDNLGFPKGKNKTMIVDLTDKFIVSDYRVRIRTNMQIFWDHIFIATDVTNKDLGMISLQPVLADLHYRGFSALSRKDFSSPHLPDYYDVTTGQKWRDLTGVYTRYGDVLPLLLESDNKYVIMNAGDEISLEFTATELPELPNNWTRNFLFYNDGWLKDGDLNTAHGQTTKPLPFHGMSSYPYGPSDSYPNDQESIDYLEFYNTRTVTTKSFKNAIRDYSTLD